jgi:hypothetical protein
MTQARLRSNHMTTDQIENLSTKAEQCFEHLKAQPGDQPLADCLMRILRQLPQGSPWLRLHKLVSIYNVTYAPILDAQLERYRRLDSLETVVRFDNLYKYKDSEDQREKIYHHQRRLGAYILNTACDELSANLEGIAQCQSFRELLHCIESVTKPVPRFGELAVYDTALRIGANRNIWPTVVYLHAGTMKGYQELAGTMKDYKKLMKTRVRTGWVPLDDLPEVRVLKPRHAENFLCIFEGLLSNGRSRRTGRPCC